MTLLPAASDLVVVTGELRQKLQQDGRDQPKNFLQALLGERGAKPMVELLRMIEQAPKSASKLKMPLDEMQRASKESLAALRQRLPSNDTDDAKSDEGSWRVAGSGPAFSRAQPVQNQIFQALQDISVILLPFEFLKNSIVTGIAQLGAGC